MKSALRKPEHRTIDQRAWNAICKLQGLEFRGPEELANLLKEEKAQFSAHDLIDFGYILATRAGRAGGMYYIPEWLTAVFRALTESVSPKSICDPWAGIGLLVGVLRQPSPSNETYAFSPNQGEVTLGKVLVPEADWRVGDSLQLLEEMQQDLDVVVSVLPIGARSARPLSVSLPSGNSIELRGDLGNLVMVAASMRLSPSGVGLFVVTPSFFFSKQSVLKEFGKLGLGVEAALALPPGTFAPYTSISGYLVVVRRKPTTRMFVAQLSDSDHTNLQIISNFRQQQEGGTLELGRFVDPQSFRGLDSIRADERLKLAEQRYGTPATSLEQLASEINLGRTGDDFTFPTLENSIFVPLIGSSDVVASIDDMKLKKQNYAQIVIDKSKSNASFVKHFLNSELGKELREQNKSGAVIPKLNKQTLKELRIFVPDLATQQTLLEIETKLRAEQNTVLALQNELAELSRELWARPQAAADVEQRASELARRLAGGIEQHTAERIDQWFETLPFPLASILRAWQATQSDDFKTKSEHLLHFFEATAEFLGITLLSAFSSNNAIFEPHKQKLAEVLQKQNLSFHRATFGTWKLVVEYLGKQTRKLLNENGKKPDDAKNDVALCADMFADPSLLLPQGLSRTELVSIITATIKMRNDWGGHGGALGQDEAKLRNLQLLGEVQKLREAIADTWGEIQLIHALHCRPRRGVFENEVAILMGSNSEFLKETRAMAIWLDVECLYLSKNDSGRALKLLPLVQVGASPQSAKNACYFFNRMESDGARFISYHFSDKPELIGEFADAADTIKFLSEV